jgi:hypothetical protein
MPKASTKRVPPETSLSRYDWSQARRGRYAKSRLRTAQSVLIHPDVYDHFGSPEAINEALRAIVRLSAVVKPKRRSRRRSAA